MTGGDGASIGRVWEDYRMGLCGGMVGRGLVVLDPAETHQLRRDVGQLHCIRKIP